MGALGATATVGGTGATRVGTGVTIGATVGVNFTGETTVGATEGAMLAGATADAEIAVGLMDATEGAEMVGV